MSLELTIKGTIYWPYLTRVHPESKRYQITLGQLDRDVAKQLKDAGATIMNKEGEGLSITVKSQFPVEVVDSAGSVLSADYSGKIGNGSEGIAKVIIKESKFKNPAQGLNGLMVTKLVEYNNTGKKTTWEKQEGFKVGDEGWEDQVNE